MSDYPGLVTKKLTWAEETMLCINKLTPSIEGKAFDPDWFLLRQRLEQFEAEVIARNAQPSPTNDYGRYKCDTCGHPSIDLSSAVDHAVDEHSDEAPVAEREARPVQQPATEPDERAQYEKWLESLPQCSDGCDGDLIGLDHGENCPLKGIGFATHWDAWQARAALALRDVPQGPDDREIVAEWRSCLCAAWASGHRAVMTMLLERGPSYPARSVPVGPTKEEK